MNPGSTHGAISWNELMSSDPARVGPFYADLFGWTGEVMPIPQGDYHLQSTKAGPVAGIMDLPDPSVPDCWTFYVTVSDLDATRARALELGATETYDPVTVPGVGRMAGFADPQGAHFNLMEYESAPDGTGAPESSFADGFATPGAFSWYHVNARDVEASAAFYQDLLGWHIRRDTMPGGPYRTIVVAGEGIGGIIPVAAPEFSPHWTAFVTVADVDETLERAVKGGGSVVVPAMDVPGVGRIAELADPTGAMLWIAAYVPMAS